MGLSKSTHTIQHPLSIQHDAHQQHATCLTAARAQCDTVPPATLQAHSQCMYLHRSSCQTCWLEINRHWMVFPSLMESFMIGQRQNVLYLRLLAIAVMLSNYQRSSWHLWSSEGGLRRKRATQVDSIHFKSVRSWSQQAEQRLKAVQ